MFKLQRKINHRLNFLRPFAMQKFDFKSRNLRKMFNEMNEEDKVRFNFNHIMINWSTYIAASVKGVRRHLFKEKDETIIAARWKVFFLFWVKLLLEILLTSGVVLIFGPAVYYIWNAFHK
jgi:hypothetical protein